MVPFFSKTLNQILTPKNGHFGFFQLIESYAEINLLIDKEIISQEGYYRAQQSLNRVKSTKFSIREKKLPESQ